MFKKKKEAPKPQLPKEYVWALDIEGEDHEFKCLVTEDEVITYEDGVECKHLKIMDKTQMQGVLQIDCKTRVFDEITDFQLENGIPYIKLEDDEGEHKWFKSDTTKEDELQARIRSVKKESYFYAALGVVFLIWALLQRLITGHFDEVFMVPVMGIFCFTCCGMQLVRLKNELNAMGRKFTWKL
jgi:hypothetical protein